MFVLRYIIEYRLYCQIALCHVVVAFIVSRLSSIITQLLSRGYHLLSRGCCCLVIAYYQIDIVDCRIETVYRHMDIVA